jgi:hypothetical protein
MATRYLIGKGELLTTPIEAPRRKSGDKLRPYTLEEARKALLPEVAAANEVFATWPALAWRMRGQEPPGRSRRFLGALGVSRPLKSRISCKEAPGGVPLGAGMPTHAIGHPGRNQNACAPVRVPGGHLPRHGGFSRYSRPTVARLMHRVGPPMTESPGRVR